MTVSEMQQPGWVAEGLKSVSRSPATELGSAVDRIRKDAAQRFNELGLPTAAKEEWKYTDIGPLARAKFELVSAIDARQLDAARELLKAELSPLRAVFINGVFAEGLSTLGSNRSRLKISRLSTLLGDASADPEMLAAVKARLGTLAPAHENSFVAMNSAFLRDAVVVFAPKDARSEVPLHIAYLNGGASAPAMAYQRVLVVAAENSETTVLESFHAFDDGEYFSNQVTEVFMAPGARVDHYKVQLESEQAFHYGAICASVERSCEFRTHTFSFGGALVRNEVYPSLNGEGCTGVLNGLTVLRSGQHTDNTTVIDHAKAHCESHELYKGIYADSSSGAFSGTIIVRPDAQKTNALQTNQSLLLSADASVDSRPQLKIWADDVKCTHGATVGQLDENAMFYLRSRGVPQADARNMLIHAFASDVISGVRVQALRTALESALTAKLEQMGAIEHQ